MSKNQKSPNIHGIAAGVLALALVGCSGFPTKPHPVEAVLTPLDSFSAETRAILIAGDNDSANFAEEILAQRHELIRRGVKPEHISCYYAPPTEEDRAADRAQFAAVEKKIGVCHLADLRILQQHLEILSRNQALPYLYVYFSGHGSAPLATLKQHYQQLSDSQKNSPSVKKSLERAERWAFWRPNDESFSLSMNAVQGKGPMRGGEVFAARGYSPTLHEIYLTPHNLTYALSKFSPKIPKFIVLQGCFSGGFLAPIPTLDNQTIFNFVGNATVLTASRAERVSFGCSPGEQMTEFGRAYLSVFKNRTGQPHQMDWTVIHKAVDAEIRYRESVTQIAGGLCSLPQLGSNASAAKTTARTVKGE